MVDGIELGALDERARTRLRREKIGFVLQTFQILPYLTLVQIWKQGAAGVMVIHSAASAAIADRWHTLSLDGLVERRGRWRWPVVGAARPRRADQRQGALSPSALHPDVRRDCDRRSAPTALARHRQ